MADSNKEVMYVDIDDEITGIIDKVRNADGRIVALVLPKRAAVLQSIVNMKLLKSSADEAKKHIVLITNEAGLMPLAGAVGLRVAKTLTSKPEIPAAPGVVEGALDTSEISEEITAENAGDRPVGELAGAAAAPVAAHDPMETLELDNEDTPEADDTTATKGAAVVPKKDKKLKVPNFNRFRLLLAFGGLLLIALLVFLYLAVNVLPKATIAIKTNASNVNVDTTLTLDTEASSLNLEQGIVPAEQVQKEQTSTEQVAATGQQNKGTRATGTVNMTATKCSGNPFIVPQSVPAGTGISTNGQTYITQEDAVFQGTGADHGCFTYSAGEEISIVAQGPGEKYNVSSADFTVAGRSDVKATGSASGGTDNVVKVVTQADINNAKQKISANDDSVRQDLANQLEDRQLYAITPTFKATVPKITATPRVGEAADTVTVTQTVTYTMLGAKKSDLSAVIVESIKGQIDDDKQSILDDGLAKANFNLTSTTGTRTELSLETTSVIGPELDVDDIKRLAAGQKSGAIKSLIGQQPGVEEVEVRTSPFWVTSAPKKLEKIKVEIAKPTATIKSDASNP